MMQVLDGWEKDLNVTTIFSPSNATNVVGVRIKTFKGPIVSLNEQCVQNLLYPSQMYAHHPTNITTIHICVAHID